MTLAELEAALDAGKLEVECQWANGRWYAVRRNGATKRWKRDRLRYRVPCKTGVRDCFAIATYAQDGDLKPYSSRLRIKP
jgi:hypothetical protein